MNTTPGTRSAKLLREYHPSHWQSALQGATFQDKRLVLAGSAYLLRLAPDSGRVVDRLETFPASGGLAFDGHHLWQRSDDRLEQLETRTGFVLQSVPTDFEDVTGLECFERELLLLHAAGHRLTRIRVKSHGLQKEAVVVGEADTGAALRGLAWAGGELWSSTGDALVRIDPASAQPLDRLPLPVAAEVRDIAADTHGRFWCVDGTTDTVRVFARPGWVEATGEPPDGHPLAQAPLSSRVVEVPASTGPVPQPEKPSVTQVLASAARTFDRIVVPIELKRAFSRTLGTALLLRERFGSELHIVYLAEQESNSEFLAGAGALLGYGAIAPEAKGQLHQFVEDLFPGRAHDFSLHVRVAHDLVDTVRRISRELEPTLVLLTDLPHRAFSTSKNDRIVRDLKEECTVMVLPARAVDRQ
jgi:hypothetical protein